VSRDFEDLFQRKPEGLYCAPGGFYIDPAHPVEKAVITHGHSDHARPGHSKVLATAETLEIMKIRLRDGAGHTLQAQPYGEWLTIGDVRLCLQPAGHILGSAQIVIDYQGRRAVISGDYKRQRDKTCAPLELVTCDLFITEATFGLPVFVHGDDLVETKKILDSLAAFPDRAHLIGVYGLGKCQRLISLLRQLGYERPIYLHGAAKNVTDFYVSQGIALGQIEEIGDDKSGHAGEIILCPPSSLNDRWSRRFNDPVIGFASGWMRVRGRARQKGVELPIVISDHVDWPDLLQTIRETEAGEVWVTHGREDATVHAVQAMGKKARALAMIGREEEE
jgi:putative mRNA 3-end processing factor